MCDERHLAFPEGVIWLRVPTKQICVRRAGVHFQPFSTQGQDATSLLETIEYMRCLQLRVLIVLFREIVSLGQSSGSAEGLNCRMELDTFLGPD